MGSVNLATNKVNEKSVPANVVVVDDEERVREVVATYLERDGFDVRTAADGAEALAHIAERRPDALVLDLMLPKVSGIEVLSRLRESENPVAVIVLSAKGKESERVAGLELGADDYIAKPASPREIAARVRAVLRRAKPNPASQIEFGDIAIDVAARQVKRRNLPLELRPKEFELLVCLAAQPGVVQSRTDLLQAVWGSSPEWQDPGTVTVHMRRLRRVVENDPSNPVHLSTVYGVGYRFDP